MLRGSEVSLQAEGGWGVGVSCSTTFQHEYAWKSGILQPSLLVLFRLTHTEVAADCFLNYHFFSTHLRSGQSSCCHAAASQWHFCTRWLVLCLPGAVTFSLLAPAHGKFTQSRWYEVRPWNELVTCSPVHTFGQFYVFVCYCMSAASQKFLYAPSLSFFGQTSSFIYAKVLSKSPQR